MIDDDNQNDFWWRNEVPETSHIDGGMMLENKSGEYR